MNVRDKQLTKLFEKFFFFISLVNLAKEIQSTLDNINIFSSKISIICTYCTKITSNYNYYIIIIILESNHAGCIPYCTILQVRVPRVPYFILGCLHLKMFENHCVSACVSI